MLEFEFLCPYISQPDLAKRFPAARLYRTWDELLAVLRERHGDGPVKVAVYPCAPLQYVRGAEGRR